MGRLLMVYAVGSVAVYPRKRFLVPLLYHSLRTLLYVLKVISCFRPFSNIEHIIYMTCKSYYSLVHILSIKMLINAAF